MCEMISLPGFDLHFPDDWQCQAFFIYPLAICMSSLEKCLFKTLANFYLVLCCPLLPSIFPSVRVFSSESALHIWWPKDWSFSLSISPSDDYLGLISFRIDWFDLLWSSGGLSRVFSSTVKSFSSSVLCLLYAPFANPRVTPGRTVALTVQTFVSAVRSLLFNLLSRLVIAFLPRSKCLLTS